MLQEDISEKMLKDYKSVEVDFRTELMSVCRKYITQLDTVSILGIIDIVRTEAIKLEQATKHHDEKPSFDNENSNNPFNTSNRL